MGCMCKSQRVHSGGATVGPCQANAFLPVTSHCSALKGVLQAPEYYGKQRGLHQALTKLAVQPWQSQSMVSPWMSPGVWTLPVMLTNVNPSSHSFLQFKK